MDHAVTPRFGVGDTVTVAAREASGHIRTPYYIRGKTGTVVDYRGTFANPELLAAGGIGVPYKQLYRVAFRQAEVWPDYQGGAADTLVIDIYEHWLASQDKH